ncbi:HNH endonuclease [Leptospira ryugenii]|uniref:HNH endonuclease n=1 Tax=Leptospira ryugenii TaxID=1917863 RepID=A0A2P2DXW3_9LEPT|nr:HNH endonuclease signature motif containing protein [Leptospira ryugenii]GBF49463.1 HNH endonuclease [Leptospira ryugenii]
MEKFKLRASHIRELLKKQEYRCYLSGVELNPDNVDIEHIVPLGKGGLHELTNLCLIERSFRELKRYHTVEEIKDLCQKVVLHGC